jgi:hypothetical protein
MIHLVRVIPSIQKIWQVFMFNKTFYQGHYLNMVMQGGIFLIYFFFFFSINVLDLMPYLMHLTFGFISHFFLPNYHISTKLNLSHPLVLKANSLHLWLAFRSSKDPLFVVVFMVRNGLHTMIPLGILSMSS